MNEFQCDIIHFSTFPDAYGRPRDDCFRVSDNTPGQIGHLILGDYGDIVKFWPRDMGSNGFFGKRHFSYFRKDFRERNPVPALL